MTQVMSIWHTSIETPETVTPSEHSATQDLGPTGGVTCAGSRRPAGSGLAPSCRVSA